MADNSAPEFAPANGDERSPLGLAQRGFRGTIGAIVVTDGHGVSAAEIERRLLELGFVEGARVEVLHEGPPAAAIRSPCASTTPPLRCAAARRWPFWCHERRH